MFTWPLPKPTTEVDVRLVALFFLILSPRWKSFTFKDTTFRSQTFKLLSFVTSQTHFLHVFVIQWVCFVPCSPCIRSSVQGSRVQTQAWWSHNFCGDWSWISRITTKLHRSTLHSNTACLLKALAKNSVLFDLQLFSGKQCFNSN